MIALSRVPQWQLSQVIADEHGIDPTGTYHGDSDLQLEARHKCRNGSNDPRNGCKNGRKGEGRGDEL